MGWTRERETQAAARIRRLFGQATAAARTAVERARACGVQLLAAKAQVPHGSWLEWLHEHCPEIPDRTASRYMFLASRWQELAGKTATVADLSLRRALALLSEDQDAAAVAGAATLKELLAGLTAEEIRDLVRAAEEEAFAGGGSVDPMKWLAGIEKAVERYKRLHSEKLEPALARLADERLEAYWAVFEMAGVRGQESARAA